MNIEKILEFNVKLNLIVPIEFFA